MNHGDIKLTLDILNNELDDGELLGPLELAIKTIEDCGNEIARLKAKLKVKENYEELVQHLIDPELHFPGNFDTVKRANALLMCLCQEAADAIKILTKPEGVPSVHVE